MSLIPSPLPEPTAHLIDPETGALAGATAAYGKRIEDLAGVYADDQAFKSACVAAPGRIVYRVKDFRPVAERGDLIFGTTRMEPGRIGREFFVTRGHIHARGNRPETYRGESGRGLMLMESPEGEIRILDVAPRMLVYVPPLWIHRSVNTGDTALVMSFCYPSDAGQDYTVIQRSGGMAVRIVATDDPQGPGWQAVANEDYRPRSTDEITAIYATQD